jgi:hypothetical protein
MSTHTLANAMVRPEKHEAAADYPGRENIWVADEPPVLGLARTALAA